MIKHTLDLLAKVLSHLVDPTGKHEVVPVWSEDPQREATALTAKAKVSYLQISAIDNDTELKTRRNTWTVKQDDGTYLEVRVVPVNLTLTWHFPVNSGVKELWRWIQLCYQVASGDANFEVTIPVGTGGKRVALLVNIEGGLSMPSFEGDVRESTVPMADISLLVRNAYVILPPTEVVQLEAIRLMDLQGLEQYSVTLQT